LTAKAKLPTAPLSAHQTGTRDKLRVEIKAGIRGKNELQNIKMTYFLVHGVPIFGTREEVAKRRVSRF
jgi:hypothetical protein